MRDSEKVKSIIRDAGGRIVGRTKLQKVSFFLEMASLGDGFRFKYKHYGPFSEELATATEDAVALRNVCEKVYPASWGGFYSDFSLAAPEAPNGPPERLKLARTAAEADSVELELAATALFLSAEFEDPWAETARRKPEKADGDRLSKAKELYRRLYAVVPSRLPAIV
ncbi:hypothetical protein [Sinorhizobium saheli]|uniref:Antitoxin SocA-like Panacea domain-containing protein n=1 Tax=Sinorhizobium saheli TaxID=36856 RepID=A0A178YHI0_SINSA|nr:hypothetical protein [Sinorhizobium saheli]MQW85352.1 hypothetical protein [Sinorhizobium saheli]OAP46998.1 hypothetical protein ATB98_14030 [Sinorhizobium saheli]